MYRFENNPPINHVVPQRFGPGIWGISPLTAGLIGAGIGFIGAELFDGPGFGGGYGPGPGYIYGPGPGYGYGPGPGYGPYPGPGYGGYNPGYNYGKNGIFY